MKVLITSDYYGENIPGGADKSLRIMIEGLLRFKSIYIKILARETNKINKKNISINSLNKIISRFQTKTKKIIRPFGTDFFLYTLQILKTINKFKPDIIITQRTISYPTILCARIKHVPVIRIIRGTLNICPKHVDIIKYGKNCPALKNRKICYNCINYWRTLRIILGDKPKGWEKSLIASFHSVFYKFRYYLVRLNLKILNFASIIMVASQLMKNTLSHNIDSEKVKIINITPVKKIDLDKFYSKKNYSEIDYKLKLIKNPLLFITPTYKAYHKGEVFVKKLAKMLPESYKIIIVGKKIEQNKINEKILNLNQLSSDTLYFLYRKAKITLVPSFYTETFGRVIIESFINKTPVIASPNCGANEFFKVKKYLKILPLKLRLWENAIKSMIENPPIIKVEDVDEVYKLFSVDKSNNDLINLIKDVIKESHR